MSKVLWGGLAALVVTGSLLYADHLIGRHRAVELDERPGAYQAPRRVLARIQSDLERVALGGFIAPLPLTEPRDPLERVVVAYDAFLRGRITLFRDEVAAVRSEVGRRLGRDITAEPANGPLLPTMIQALRQTEAVLAPASAAAVLALPCPTLIGRVADFAAAARMLGEAAGPLTSCPLGDVDRLDFVRQEKLAHDPKALAAAYVPPPPPPEPDYGERLPSPPWNRDGAIRYMGDNSDAAEPALRMAALDSLVGKLDLALFLHALRDQTPVRDDDIRALVASVDRASLAKATPDMLRFAGSPLPYDGTDVSLLPSLRLAAFTRVADIPSGSNYLYPYVIPCAVWQRRPGLGEAIGGLAVPPTEADGTVRLSLPLLGCLVGRGRVAGFPEADFAAFLNAAVSAEGGKANAPAKRPRYPLAATEMERMGRIVFNPAALLAEPAPTQVVPFQTWAYSTLANHAAARSLIPLFERSRASLAVWFRAKGLGEAEAMEAANRALFHSAIGADCGEAAPPASVRTLVMDGAAPDAITAQLAAPPADLKPLNDCAAWTPFDPLLLVAVGNPAALPLLWDAAEGISPEADFEGVRSIRRVNFRNGTGKTALMAAAEADQPESIRFLLEHGARIEADTWQPQVKDHDGRTALMVGAANASLATIRQLLAAGGDPRHADSSGQRALHYLLGAATGIPNPRLSPAERLEAAKLLW